MYGGGGGPSFKLPAPIQSYPVRSFFFSLFGHNIFLNAPIVSGPCAVIFSSFLARNWTEIRKYVIMAYSASFLTIKN